MNEDQTQNIRRLALKTWLHANGGARYVCTQKGVGKSVESHISQMLRGYSFGARAARNLEIKLGIPHGFAVMHGKTRRGALVFDIADIVKDAIVLPLAFICAKENASEQEFRQECLNYFTTYKALDVMFDTVKDLALKKDFETL